MNINKMWIAVLCAAAIAGAKPVYAACSNASIQGTYGVLSAGLNGSLQPSASVNQIILDGKGNLTGSSTKSIDGTIVTYTFSGTYTIAATCNGSATFTNQSGQTEHSNIYLDQANGTAIFQGAFLIQTDKNHVQPGVALNQGAATCTDLGVKRSYAFTLAGTDLGVGQIAAGGRVTLNGTGGLTGTMTVSKDGTISPGLALTGNYSISSLCTGTLSITPKGLATMNFNLVVVTADKEIMVVETDANTVVSGTLQQ